jgi:hypothetical protein
MIIIFILMLAVPIYLSANIALWIFGVRPYIHRHGRACITAANWGYSIWADLTTAWEIGKEESSIPMCVKLLFALQVVELFFIAFVVLASIMQ